jgi:hypothetical protein
VSPARARGIIRPFFAATARAQMADQSGKVVPSVNFFAHRIVHTRPTLGTKSPPSLSWSRGLGGDGKFIAAMPSAF